MLDTKIDSDLLDPKNDYVFFRIFSEVADLLIDLINAVRVGEEPIVADERGYIWVELFSRLYINGHSIA